jgi:hypothetical protein
LRDRDSRAETWQRLAGGSRSGWWGAAGDSARVPSRWLSAMVERRDEPGLLTRASKPRREADHDADRQCNQEEYPQPDQAQEKQNEQFLGANMRHRLPSLEQAGSVSARVEAGRPTGGSVIDRAQEADPFQVRVPQVHLTGQRPAQVPATQVCSLQVHPPIGCALAVPRSLVAAPADLSRPGHPAWILPKPRVVDFMHPTVVLRLAEGGGTPVRDRAWARLRGQECSA